LFRLLLLPFRSCFVSSHSQQEGRSLTSCPGRGWSLFWTSACGLPAGVFVSIPLRFAFAVVGCLLVRQHYALFASRSCRTCPRSRACGVLRSVFPGKSCGTVVVRGAALTKRPSDQHREFSAGKLAGPASEW
jgi:hypothetical protein